METSIFHSYCNYELSAASHRSFEIEGRGSQSKDNFFVIHDLSTVISLQGFRMNLAVVTMCHVLRNDLLQSDADIVLLKNFEWQSELDQIGMPRSTVDGGRARAISLVS